MARKCTALIRPERSMLWCRKVLKPPKQDQIAMTTLLKMSLRKLPDPRARIAISMLVLNTVWEPESPRAVVAAVHANAETVTIMSL